MRQVDNRLVTCSVCFQGWTEEELEKRKSYLRAQRDKLVELKKKEREKQLIQEEASTDQRNLDGDVLKRPKSARAAHLALQRPNVVAETKGGKNSGHQERSLTARRALANILKQELLQSEDEK